MIEIWPNARRRWYSPISRCGNTTEYDTRAEHYSITAPDVILLDVMNCVIQLSWRESFICAFVAYFTRVSLQKVEISSRARHECSNNPQATTIHLTRNSGAATTNSNKKASLASSPTSSQLHKILTLSVHARPSPSRSQKLQHPSSPPDTR